MVIVYPGKQFVTHTGRVRQGYYLDEALRSNLDLLKKRVENKYDGCILITGSEGSGKSTLSQAVAYYLNPNLKVENIVFSGRELLNRIEVCKKFEVLIYDESITDISSADHAAEIHKTLIKVFTMMRSRQFYIILILPNIFQLRRYFSVTRSLFLLHTYSMTGYDRGYFRFYSFRRKKQMILKGYKDWNMSATKPNFSGRFTNTEGFFFNNEEYEKKKQAAITALTTDSKSKDQLMKEKFEDDKLKLKIQVEQWKEKYKLKVEEQIAKLRQQVLDKKKKYNDDLSQIKTQAIDLQKSSDKERINKLEKELAKVLYYYYDVEKRNFMRDGKPLDVPTFSRLLKERLKIDADIRKYVQSGEELNTIGL